MSLTDVFSGQLLKVAFGSDVRRLKLDLPSGASTPEEVMRLMRAAIAEGFGLAEGKAPTLRLKYTDDEGDLCTLTECTICDLAGQLPKDVLRLSMEVPASPSTALPVEEASGQCHEPESAPQEDGASSGANHDALAELAMQFLPMLAVHASMPNQRLEANSFGVAKRDAILRPLQNAEKRLDRLPETRHLKPAMQAFVDGTDMLHFGDLCADVLQALSTAADRAVVKTIVRETLKDAMAAHPFFHNLGALQDLLGGLGGQQQSTSSQGHPPGVYALQGLLGGLPGAAQAGGGFPFPATADSPKATAAYGDLERNAASLVEMQLAVDLEAARALLRRHSGDISAVVASFE